MEYHYDLSRYAEAHQRNYRNALAEIRGGKKTSHWMWYIFPQLKGLGRSSTSAYYGIRDLNEAKAFLQDACLGAHLREISEALLTLESNNAYAIMGSPDDKKLQSCMTLFSLAAPEEPVFANVLAKFFHGRKDWRTVSMLSESESTDD